MVIPLWLLAMDWYFFSFSSEWRPCILTSATAWTYILHKCQWHEYQLIHCLHRPCDMGIPFYHKHRMMVKWLMVMCHLPGSVLQGAWWRLSVIIWSLYFRTAVVWFCWVWSWRSLKKLTWLFLESALSSCSLLVPVFSLPSLSLPNVLAEMLLFIL